MTCLRAHDHACLRSLRVYRRLRASTAAVCAACVACESTAACEPGCVACESAACLSTVTCPPMKASVMVAASLVTGAAAAPKPRGQGPHLPRPPGPPALPEPPASPAPPAPPPPPGFCSMTCRCTVNAEPPRGAAKEREGESVSIWSQVVLGGRTCRACRCRLQTAGWGVGLAGMQRMPRLFCVTLTHLLVTF